jgi:ribonucleoside-diphosphate reductase alpha chain
VAERLLFAAHSASAELAQQVGAFPLWEGSRWRNADWLDRKRDKRSGVVSDSEWGALHGQILRTGIRNANVVAFPPTGIVSEILRVSKSYEPHFTLAGRTRASATSALQIAPEVAEVLDREVGGDTSLRSILDPASGHQLSGAEPDHLLACARQLPTSVHLAVHAIFCGLADESGSKTVNLAADCTVSDVACLIREARSLGLKGLTVFRDKCLESRGHQKERDAA